MSEEEHKSKPEGIKISAEAASAMERWEMRVPDGHCFVEDDGNVIDAGRTLEVAAPQGRRLAEHGYELVSIREARPGD